MGGVHVRSPRRPHALRPLQVNTTTEHGQPARRLARWNEHVIYLLLRGMETLWLQAGGSSRAYAFVMKTRLITWFWSPHRYSDLLRGVIAPTAPHFPQTRFCTHRRPFWSLPTHTWPRAPFSSPVGRGFSHASGASSS